MHIYIWQIYPPQLSRDALHTAARKLDRSTGISNLPGQLNIDALNTVTPNLANLLADLPPVN